jgi:hypothetical protein
MKRQSLIRALSLAALVAAYAGAAQWALAANSFYNASGAPAQGSALSSSVIRTEFTAIQTGFDKMPVLSGHNGTAIVVDGGGTTLTNTVGTLALAGNFATTGAFNTTFIQSANVSLTLPGASDTLVGRATTDTLTNKSISGSANTITNIGNAALTNSSVTIGSTSVSLGATATTIAGLTLATPTIAQILNTGTLTLPTSTDTLVGKATTDIFTNKTFDTAGTGNVLKINGTAISDKTGTGKAVLDTNPVITGATVNGSTLSVPTRQVLTSGSGATYTTPAGVRQLRIRMVGGGGGGGGGGSGASAGTAGGDGGDTIFNSIHAAGGRGGAGGGNAAVNAAGGAGGSGGSGSASWRSGGQGGGAGTFGTSANTAGAPGGTGGSSVLGGGGPGAAAGTGTPLGYGGGGGGADTGNQDWHSGAGGGGGEYVELIINSPASTYTYTIGSGGSAGGTRIGTPGFAGVIIVDEVY